MIYIYDRSYIYIYICINMRSNLLTSFENIKVRTTNIIFFESMIFVWKYDFSSKNITPFRKLDYFSSIFCFSNMFPYLSVALKGSYSMSKGAALLVGPSGSPGSAPSVPPSKFTKVSNCICPFDFVF